MEKFGIFELLDALSAITETLEPPTPPLSETEKRTPDAAFSVPDYGTELPPPPQETEAHAIDNFLARHDAFSKKAKK